MGKKTDRKRRAQHKAQKARAQARERALPPGPVAVECRDESGRPIPAVCAPPEPRWSSLADGRARVRYYSPSPRERAAEQGRAFVCTLIDGCSGEILVQGGHDLDRHIRSATIARRSAGHPAR